MVISLNCLESSIASVDKYVTLMNWLVMKGHTYFTIVEDNKSDFFIISNWNKVMELVDFPRESISLVYIGNLENAQKYEDNNIIFFDTHYELNNVNYQEINIFDILKSGNLDGQSSTFYYSRHLDSLVELINKVMVRGDLKIHIKNEHLLKARLTILSESLDIKKIMNEKNLIFKIDSIELLEFLLAFEDNLNLNVYSLVEEILRDHIDYDSKSEGTRYENE
ncbi:hypothetical protein P7E43_05270 [Enterococcus gallinarum]|uniref:hypothetical protein n=1 Tax=Enterococcus gallinarum TaxID=1353 RepID=UPI00288E1503|nr:hypothetical protein [Enterococcus gallinarum]MDT2696463.1 hypothetical protein [Enterococcus gallinarum]